ncbi:MAG: Trk system potassium transporter TrkA [Oscillospiraceae bacterium]|nr:Trk system potassium transporter TrkA [Oscillospiraceae bacterium]
MGRKAMDIISMNVVIVGGGKVGRKLVKDFNNEGENIVLIDIKNSVCERVEESYDVRCVNGIGTNLETLNEAEVRKADLFIAVTENDEYNALCAVMAKKLGAERCVARVRNRVYFKQLDFMRSALGIDLIVNPEYATASEISRILRFPAAINAETFAKGRVELIEFNIGDDNSLCDKALYEIYKKYKIKVLICAVQRGSEVYIPNGDFIIRKGDKLHITASHRDLTLFMREIGVIQKKVKSAILIGGGRISFYLAKLLLESGMQVKIIESNMERCQELAEYLPKVDIVYGDGTDKNVLSEEGIDRVDSLVALTGIDEENMIISMYAKTRDVDKIVTKVNRISFADLMDDSGVYSIVTPKNITADIIIRYARAMKSAKETEIVTLYRIVNNQAEALEFIVNKESELTSKSLSQIKIKKNVLIAAILHNNKMFVPDGNSRISVGDTVVVVTTQHLTTLSDILE